MPHDSQLLGRPAVDPVGLRRLERKRVWLEVVAPAVLLAFLALAAIRWIEHRACTIVELAAQFVAVPTVVALPATYPLPADFADRDPWSIFPVAVNSKGSTQAPTPPALVPAAPSQPDCKDEIENPLVLVDPDSPSTAQEPESDATKVDVPAVEAPQATPSDALRYRVRTESGQTLVGRLYAQEAERRLVQLPDGSLGWTNGTVPTDEPFRAWTADEVRDSLLTGPLAGFKSMTGPRYVVLYAGSEAFARNSARLLESLYDGLLNALKAKQFPVHHAEFPLVAVIFANKDDFRRHHPVADEVQAYYEIYSNRIFLYESSDLDRIAPDVAALRKPQTVAHEGTHQILQNIGLQPRLAPWPAWIVEGLAEYCAPTTTDPRGQWASFGKVNPFHMATLIDLQDPAALSQHLQGVVAGQNGGAAVPLGRDLRSAWINALVTRDDLTSTDYALAWGLTHYLASRQPEPFRAYLRKLGTLQPLERRTPAQQLGDFREAFGGDLRKLSERMVRHLSSLRYAPLPYYAVYFEQAVPGGLVRRGTIVSQSQAVIQQWLQSITDPSGATPRWRADPYPSRNQARLATEGYLRGP